MATQPTQSNPTTALEPALPPQSAPAPMLPPLENGDVLTRPEFERRYEAMPWLKKAELIEGVVYVGAAVSMQHAQPDARLSALLTFYADHTPGVASGTNATVRLDLLNEPQPDALLRISVGGQSAGDQYVEGAPELVAEVAASSVSRDLHSKLAVYRRHAVREYVVWRVRDEAIDWFVLMDGDYQRLAPDERGIFRSRVFPGLSIDGPALLRGDTAVVWATLQAGLASDEHAEFVASLAARK